MLTGRQGAHMADAAGQAAAWQAPHSKQPTPPAQQAGRQGHRRAGTKRSSQAGWAPTGEAAILQNLEHHVEDIGVRLLNLIKQHHRVRPPPAVQTSQAGSTTGGAEGEGEQMQAGQQEGAGWQSNTPAKCGQLLPSSAPPSRAGTQTAPSSLPAGQPPASLCRQQVGASRTGWRAPDCLGQLAALVVADVAGG